MSVGFDKKTINHQLLFGPTFEEMTGLLAHDRAKPRHPLTLNGVPTWASLANGLPYLDFDAGNPDWLQCPAADSVDLNFTAGDFSIVACLNLDVIGGQERCIAERGQYNTSGWSFRVLRFGYIQFETYQNPGRQVTHGYNLWGLTGIFHVLGMSRVGPSVTIFHNGQDVTEGAASHVDPGPSGQDLYIGRDRNGSDFFDGKIAGGPCPLRIWGRALTALEHHGIFQSVRDWLGV